MAVRYLLEERTILEHGKTVETVEGVNAKLPPDLFLSTRPDPTLLLGLTQGGQKGSLLCGRVRQYVSHSPLSEHSCVLM